MLGVAVHPASIDDRVAGRVVLDAVAERYPSLRHLWADQGYRGTLVQWAAEIHAITVELSATGQRSTPDGRLIITPRRWVVERSFAWLGRFRRMSKDYEYLPDTQRTMIHLCMIRLMLQRLATEEFSDTV